MIMCLLGLLRTERLAREMSAVTRVMEILEDQAGRQEVRVWVGKNTLSTHRFQARHPCLCLRVPKWSFQTSCSSPSGSGEPSLRVSPAIKAMLQEVKQCFLHHVCYLSLRGRVGEGGLEGRGEVRL